MSTAILGLTVAIVYGASLTARRLFGSYSEPPAVVRVAPYFIAGLTFSLGLLMSGMASPLKVVSFLHLLPPWTSFDPSLAMVVLTGVLPNTLHYVHLRRSVEPSGKSPVRYMWESWQVPSRTDIDWRLLLGAAIFGIGWGLSGVCPGPAIVSFGSMMVDGLRGFDVGGSLRGWVSFSFPLIVGMRLARVLIA